MGGAGTRVSTDEKLIDCRGGFGDKFQILYRPLLQISPCSFSIFNLNPNFLWRQLF